MTKIYGQEYFTAVVKGVEYRFFAYTTNTRNGFCHHTECYSLDIKARRSYYNRTWERFRYESCLCDCIEKIKDKALRGEIYAQIIEGKAKEEIERCEAFCSAFKGAWENLNEENKESIRKAVGENGITSEGEASAVLAMAELGVLMQK